MRNEVRFLEKKIKKKKKNQFACTVFIFPKERERR